MENTLKRLLIVETEAEQLVAKVQTEREQIVQQALQEAHQAEQQFKAKLPEIHANFLEQAAVRATQTIAELDKRYEERKVHLRNLADENQQKALETAVNLLMQVGKP
jgi:V/A-type H+-transporting ATPase subunit G/H